MVVIKTNGKIIPLNAKSTSRFIVKAEHRQSLLSEDTLQIALESKYPIEFNIGDKIEHNGRFFTLNFAPKVKREQGFYQYDLVFEGSQYHLRNKVFFNLDKTGFQTTADFPLTGEIDIFLRTLITNINSLNKGTWILGEFPQNTETKTLTFNGENCLAVLQKICGEYDTEFEIIENITAKTYTLNIKKIGEVLDFSFEYGKGNGLYSLTRENVNNDVVTRLYAYGSTENIANDYRNYSDRLRMPQQVGDFIQDENKVRLFELKEAVKHFDDIKPTFKGIVSRVGAFDEKTKTQEIFVENMDFDLNERDQNGTKWLINDTPAKLHFNKGNLAGYDFELIKNGGYNHDTKCFKVKQWTDERGQKFPDIGTIFEFAVGDEFTLIDIVMPDEYITRAENKLWEEAKKEYEKQSKNNVKYSLDIDPLFLKNKFSNGSKIFGIGDYIRIVDSELGVDKTSRIMNISQNLLHPFEYKLDIADDYEINFTISVLNDIKDTKTIVKTQTQINRQNYLNGIRNLAELRDNIFDTEGHFDPIHIKPNSIEANMLTIGAKNQQFALENVTLNPNVNGNPNSLYISGGKLVHFSISENIKEWTLLPIHRNDLANLTYYVYAKVGINDSFGTWEITTEKIKFNERSGYYYFLCYLLYTPKEGKRDAEAMYGNVMMHGGQISAGRIKSLNGQTYIDLDTGEISGKITFLPNSQALTQVDTAIQSKMNGLGSLAWKNAVEKAQLGETIVQGGYIKTELINAAAIVSAGGGVTNIKLNADLKDIKEKTDNFTAIQGGLISSNIIEVGKDADNRNAFISGVTNAGGLSVRFGAGANYANKNNAPFRVLDNGKLIATNAEIFGKINAESGKIGNFHIDNGFKSYTLSSDSWENGNQYFHLSPESFLMRKNGNQRGEHLREIRLGTTASVASGWDGAVATIKNTMPPESVFDQRPNVALELSAKNGGNENIALNISAGGIMVGGKKGFTGNIDIFGRRLKFENGILVE